VECNLKVLCLLSVIKIWDITYLINDAFKMTFKDYSKILELDGMLDVIAIVKHVINLPNNAHLVEKD